MTRARRRCVPNPHFQVIKYIFHPCKIAQLRPARGFDRLSSVGFSEADIASFRRQFHSQSSSNYLDVDFETEEECKRHVSLVG